MTDDELEKTFSTIETQLDSIESTVEDRIEQLREKARENKKDIRNTLLTSWDGDELNTSDGELESFIERPYVVLPKSDDELWVVVPRFIPFTLGWLQRQTESYNIFVVNRYMSWINDLPEDIESRLDRSKTFEDVEYNPEERTITFESEEERELGWERYRDYSYQRKGETEIKLNKGAEFDALAEIIDDGNLPYKPQPINEEHIRPDEGDISLRTYQERAWEKFQQTGSVGVFWPPGAGKTFFTLYAGERLKGEKLVIVPSRILKSQWEERIQKFCSNPDEWTIETYHYYTYDDNFAELEEKDIQLLVMDECHTTPANQFSRIATIGTNYRIGLSASPFREDDKEEYIFALTGHPVGLNWSELMELGVVVAPSVKAYLYNTYYQKKKDLETILTEQTGSKILIYCDSLDAGNTLSEELDIPFVSGETSNKYEQILKHDVVIVSRVGDEGVSIEDVDTIIEFDFLGKSRRQELQRAGRLMHNDNTNSDLEHIIMMTDEEYDKFSERLLSLEQKGIGVKKVRRS